MLMATLLEQHAPYVAFLAFVAIFVVVLTIETIRDHHTRRTP